MEPQAKTKQHGKERDFIMMIDPPLKDLLAQVDCRYTLVAVISKRSRQIVDERNALGESSDIKPVVQAVDDLMYDEIEYHYMPGLGLD